MAYCQMCADKEVEIVAIRTRMERVADERDAAMRDCTALRAENAKLRIDLSKPPQEREYCAGCTLPAENARLREDSRAACAIIHDMIVHLDTCEVGGQEYACPPEYVDAIREAYKVLCECKRVKE